MIALHASMWVGARVAEAKTHVEAEAPLLGVLLLELTFRLSGPPRQRSEQTVGITQPRKATTFNFRCGMYVVTAGAPGGILGRGGECTRTDYPAWSAPPLASPGPPNAHKPPSTGSTTPVT